MSDLVTDLLGRLGQVQSQPEAYAIRIEMQRRATPREFQAIAFHPLTPPDLMIWMNEMCQRLFPDGEAPVTCNRRELAPEVTLYQGDAPRRVLVLAFCGRANMLFGPLAVYLQLFIGHADVLVLGDPQEEAFTQGVEGYAPTFGEVMDRVAKDVGIEGYDEIRTFGTSGGGGPALAAGRRFDATVALSFSGRLPTRSRRYGERAGAAEIEEIIRRPRGKGQAYAVYAGGNRRDAANAELLGEIGAATPIVLRGSDDHNTVFQLFQAGKLKAFLSEVGMLAPAGSVGPLKGVDGPSFRR